MSADKSIPIYGSHKETNKYISNKDKTSVSKFSERIKDSSQENDNDHISNASDYIQNELKTKIGEQEILVSGYLCNPDTADIEFEMIRDRYYSIKTEPLTEGKRARVAYHLIQSFPPWLDIDPRLVHQIGCETAEKLGDYQAKIATHMDKAHLHNHIVINAFAYNSITKYKDNKAAIQRLRDISNEISLKYGLPIIINPDRARDSSYKEWLEINKGTSWKQQIRNDISAVKETTRTWEDFKTTMERAGYKIRETSKTVTYTLPGNDTKKSRDKNLGEPYTKEAIENFWILKERERGIISEELVHERTNTLAEHKTNKKPAKIYVSRYSSGGRRRSDLEILILLAIKVLKKLGDKFIDKGGATLFPNNPVYKPLNWKIDTMMDSLAMVSSLGIDNISDLTKKRNEIGTELSRTKKDVSDLSLVVNSQQRLTNLIEIIEDLKEHMEELGIKEDSLYIPKYNKEEIIKNRANLSPATGKQKQELYKLLNSDNHLFRLDVTFDLLTTESALAAISFLKYPDKTPKPDIIISYEEAETKRLKAKYNSIRDTKLKDMQLKYGSQLLTEKQKHRLSEIAKENGLIIDYKTLTEFDGIMLINYFNKTNPCRDIPTDRPLPKETINNSQKVQIEELLKLREETIPVPVQNLFKDEADKLHGYLLFKEYVPEILLPKADKDIIGKEQDEAFVDTLKYYDIDEQQHIYTYREALKDLSAYGIDMTNISETKEILESNIKELNELKQKEKELANEYKNLKRLEYNINLASNVKFTHGPLYKEKVLTEQQQADNKDVDKEADDIEKENNSINRNNKFRTVDSYFENTIREKNERDDYILER